MPRPTYKQYSLTKRRIPIKDPNEVRAKFEDGEYPLPETLEEQGMYLGDRCVEFVTGWEAEDEQIEILRALRRRLRQEGGVFVIASDA